MAVLRLDLKSVLCEGVGLAWPGNDLALLGLVVFYGLASLVAIRLLRSK